MFRQMLRAKIHRITVTEANLEYEGSLTLDSDLMDAAGLVPFEMIHVYNVTRGTRFSTYTIEGSAGSGACCVNGAAAHLASEGDKLIIACYGLVPAEKAKAHRPVVVLVESNNTIRAIKHEEKERAKAS